MTTAKNRYKFPLKQNFNLSELSLVTGFHRQHTVFDYLPEATF